MRKSHDFIMLIGLAGSGKSTWRNTFVKNFPNFQTFSTDDKIDAWGNDNNMNYSQAWKAISESTDPEISMKHFEEEMFLGIKEALEQRKNVIIDRTNMSVKTRKKFLDMVPKIYNRTAIVFNIPTDELQKRLKKREEETGKSIPSFVLASMSKAYQEPTSEEFDKIIFIES